MLKRILIAASIILAVGFVYTWSAKHRDAGLDPRKESIATWLNEAGVLRRGGNGKIDSEILAATITPLPEANDGSWTTKNYLVVWARFENLDPWTTWSLESDSVSISVESESAQTMACVDETVDPIGMSRAILGSKLPSGLIKEGQKFVLASIFDLPGDSTQPLVIRSFTTTSAGKTTLLVATKTIPTKMPKAVINRP